MCDPLTNPVNGQVTLTTRTAGSVATYNCEVGYNLVGNMTRTCQADTGGLDWSDSEPVCQSQSIAKISQAVSYIIMYVFASKPFLFYAPY